VNIAFGCAVCRAPGFVCAAGLNAFLKKRGGAVMSERDCCAGTKPVQSPNIAASFS
jgi:hypothetical protein